MNSFITVFITKGNYLGLALIIIFLLMFLPTLIQKRKKKSEMDAKRDRDLVEDKQLLAEAEKELNTNQTEMAIVAKFTSAEGMKDSNLMEFIMQLQNEGIDASYESTSVGMEGGALNIYYIKVPMEQKEEAYKILKDKKII